MPPRDCGARILPRSCRCIIIVRSLLGSGGTAGRSLVPERRSVRVSGSIGAGSDEQYQTYEYKKEVGKKYAQDRAAAEEVG